MEEKAQVYARMERGDYVSLAGKGDRGRENKEENSLMELD